MADDIDIDAIVSGIINNPKKGKSDEGEFEQFGPSEVLDAVDRCESNKAGTGNKKKNLNMLFRKFVPPGTV